jgi:hypothetical protein
MTLHRLEASWVAYRFQDKPYDLSSLMGSLLGGDPGIVGERRHPMHARTVRLGAGNPAPAV